MDWKSWISDNQPHLNNFTADIRISDEVLNDNDWPVHNITVQGGLVVKQEVVQEGVYTMPDMLGWTTRAVYAWVNSSEDASSSGTFPNNFHEIIIKEVC